MLWLARSAGASTPVRIVLEAQGGPAQSD
jgi:hypothetical protein